MLTTLFVNLAYGANILILHPIYCGSHELVLRNLGDYLVKRGHQVTQVSRHTFIEVKLQNSLDAGIQDESTSISIVVKVDL